MERGRDGEGDAEGRGEINALRHWTWYERPNPPLLTLPQCRQEHTDTKYYAVHDLINSYQSLFTPASYPYVAHNELCRCDVPFGLTDSHRKQLSHRARDKVSSQV